MFIFSMKQNLFSFCVGFVFVFRGCFVSAFGRHLAFCIFSPVLFHNLRIVDQAQDVNNRLSLERWDVIFLGGAHLKSDRAMLVIACRWVVRHVHWLRGATWVFSTPEGEKSLETLLDGLLTCSGWQFLSAHQYDYNTWRGAGTFWKISEYQCGCIAPALETASLLLVFEGINVSSIMEVWHNYIQLKRLWEPGFSIVFCTRWWEREPVSLVSPFHRLVRTCGRCLFACWGCWVCVSLCFLMLLTNLCDRVVTDDYFSTVSWLPQLLWRAQHWSKTRPHSGPKEW